MLVAGLSEPIIVIAVVILVLLATFLGDRRPGRHTSASKTEKTRTSTSSTGNSQ
jgi:uncharacterized membrane protein affecting hemolysin expression